MKVLVADDSELMREVMGELIKKILDCEAEIVPDGLEAIRKINQDYFDLVISDFNMPKANGIDVFFHAKKQLGKRARVIIMTGEPDRFVREAGVRLGEFSLEAESCFLEKPFKPKQLEAMIEKIMSW